MTNEQAKDKANCVRVCFTLYLQLFPIKERALRDNIYEEIALPFNKARLGFWQYVVENAIIASLNLAANEADECWRQMALDPSYAPVHNLDEPHQRQFVSYCCIFGTLLYACQEIGGIPKERSEEISNLISEALLKLHDIPSWLKRSLELINTVLTLSDEELNKRKDVQDIMQKYDMPQLFSLAMIDPSFKEME